MATSISMLEFFRSGAFGPLHLGIMRAQIEAILGPPDDYLVLSRRERRRYREEDHWRYSRGWRYGDVELFFDDVHCLRAVHIDYLFERIPSGGEKIQLDPWILHPGLSLDEAKAACTESQLTYYIRPDSFQEEVVHLVFATRIDLHFDREVEGSQPLGLRLLYFPDN